MTAPPEAPGYPDGISQAMIRNLIDDALRFDPVEVDLPLSAIGSAIWAPGVEEATRVLVRLMSERGYEMVGTQQGVLRERPARVRFRRMGVSGS